MPFHHGDVGTDGGIRTLTSRILSTVSLPVLDYVGVKWTICESNASASSLSESSGQPARHGPWYERQESNLHWAGFEAAASAELGYARMRYGA